MSRGFVNPDEFDRILGWELLEVTIDKYHVMFWFDNHQGLLNIAMSFSYKSADDQIAYSYEIYGAAKWLNADRILRLLVKHISVATKTRLDLTFSNNDILTIHDYPIYRSWWFYRYNSDKTTVNWEISDDGYP